MSTNHDAEMEMTATDALIALLTDEEHGEEATKTFFKSEFLASAVDALFYARRQAGLTQAEVADLLHTKQASIARLEADTTGSMTLRRYAEIALACGMAPLPITLVPISDARQYVVDNPEAPVAADAYTLWHQNQLLRSSTVLKDFELNKNNPPALSLIPQKVANTTEQKFEGGILQSLQNLANRFPIQSLQNLVNKGNVAPYTLAQETPKLDVSESLKTAVGQTASLLREGIAA